MPEQKKNANAFVQFIIRFLQGILTGTGAIIPGVSGGALCVIFGIYRPLMDLFAHPFKNFKKYFWMLLPVGLGIGVGFVGFSGIVDWILRTHESLAICAFIGLILGMVPQLFRDAGEKGRKGKDWAFLIVSFLLLGTLFLYLKHGAALHIVPNLGWWLVCGGIWGLNVILPGMSSSSMLIFLGLFEPMSYSVSHLDLRVIIPIVVGAVALVLALSRPVNALFANHHAAAYHVILGAVLATTAAIVPTSFGDTKEIVLSVVCAVVGFVVSLILNRISQKYLHRTEEKV